MLILNQAEVAKLLSMSNCIDLMRHAFASMAKGDAVFPLRPVMFLPGKRGVLGMMPGYVASPESIAIKVITVFPDNVNTPYDSHQGAVMLFDSTNGRILALMDASEITAIRTAAATAVATDLLARSDSSVLAILGSGVQARTHLEAIANVRNVSQVNVWSRTPERADAFAKRERDRRDISIDVCATAEDAVRNADIVCTTTAARDPILMGSWITPGMHVNAVGSSSPKMRELDASAVAKATMFVDWRESAFNEAGDFLIAKSEGTVGDDHVRGEIGDVLVGKIQGRTSDEAITLFKSLGVAPQDVVAARHIYDRAQQEGIGTTVELGGLRHPH